MTLTVLLFTAVALLVITVVNFYLRIKRLKLENKALEINVLLMNPCLSSPDYCVESLFEDLEILLKRFKQCGWLPADYVLRVGKYLSGIILNVQEYPQLRNLFLTLRENPHFEFFIKDSEIHGLINFHIIEVTERYYKDYIVGHDSSSRLKAYSFGRELREGFPRQFNLFACFYERIKDAKVA